MFSGVTTSIFIFDSGIPQNGKEIFACYIEDDGLETVKNQGRQDIKEKWGELENYWIDIITKQAGNETIQWINPQEHLSYQMPEIEFKVNKNDFVKTSVDYLLFQSGVDVKAFGEKLLCDILYSGKINIVNGQISISISRDKSSIDISN